MYTLSIITGIAPDVYLTRAVSLTILLGQTLSNLHDLRHPIAFYTLKILQNLSPLIDGNQMVSYI